VDYEKLFYLALSGFDEEEATWMLVSGFFDPVLSRLPGALKEEVRRIVSLALQAH
jgi:Fe-S cluster assembly scaffold protein SufB